MSVLPVFVYGTLRPGGAAFGRFAASMRKVEPARLDGADLYDLGPYPMAVAGAGVVWGEVLHLNPLVYHFTLHALDRYEGYHPPTDGGLFVRRAVQVTLASGERSAAWTYLGQPEQVEGMPRVPGGDWLAHQKRGS